MQIVKFNKLILFFFLMFSSFYTFSQTLFYPIYNVLILDGSPKFGKYEYKFFEPFYAPLQNFPISAPHLIDQSSYELIFEDEFNATQLDLQKWNLPHEIQDHSKLHAGGGAEPPREIGWQAFSDNYEFTGNSVKLIAKELNPPQMLKCIEYDCTYTIYGDNKPNLRLHKYSGGVLESNFNYKYGYYEAKIKLPIIENTWPAFWLFENTTEIDVFEMLRNGYTPLTPQQASSKVHMTYHFWNHNIGKSIYEKATLDIFSNPQRTIPYPITNTWHTWGLLWDNFRMIWLLDGHVLFTVYHYVLQVNKNVSIGITNNQQLLAVMNPPLLDKLKVNWGYPSEQSKLIIGMNPTNFNIDTVTNKDSDNAYTEGPLPKALEIDYVRIYAFRNCNTDLNFCDGKDLPTHILGKTVTIGSPNYNIIPCNQVVKSKGGCFGEPLCSIKNDNALQYVHCVATDKISLKPGFKVEKGAYFHGRIENCNTANLRTGNNLPEALQNIINNQPYEDSLFYAQLNALNNIPDDSISTILLNEEFMIYPNPTKGIVNFQLLTNRNSFFKIAVTDVFGRIVFNKIENTNEQKMQIDLSGNAAGVYFIQFNNGIKNYTRKIILE